MNKITDNQAENREPGKILLALLPFWDPLIPPQGIACLKRFLQGHGYRVITKAVNMERRFLVLYGRYFDIIKKIVPENRLDVLFHLGHFVLQNHMMVHINYNDEHEYTQLVKELVYKNFYIEIPESGVNELKQILIEFYRELENYFLEILAEETPDVLGLSVYKATLPASLFVFKLTRQKYPSIRTIMGGGIFADHLAENSPNLEFFREKAKDYVDKIFIGQGELLLLKYLRNELPPQQTIYTPKDINGQVLDFADSGVPDYSDFNLNRHQTISLGATASVGCKFRCSFCNEVKFFGKFRKKDPAQTAREMLALYREYGYQLFFMTDAMLNPVISDLARELINSGTALYYDSYFRVDRETADIENTLFWRRGGFYRARLGVESGSQHVLDLIGKGITPAQIKAAVSSLAYAGIKTTTYWVIGHPGETEDDFQQTLDLITQLKNDLWQAEGAPFDYYYSGQSDSDQWAHLRKLLYPANAKDMLIAQTWILDTEPSREETYRRLFRFTQHCRKLGIPNPYSINEIHSADQRWEKLHKNAVPPLLDFQKRGFIDDTGKVKKLNFVLDKWQDHGDFVF